MAEDAASTNGHRPARRPRKRIYPPPAQMAAQQAAAAERSSELTRAGSTALAEPDFGPEQTAPLAPDFGPEPAAPPPPPGLALAEPVSESAMLATIDDDRLPEDEPVELRLSAVGMVEAADVSFAQGALGAVRADNVAVDKGAIGAALANHVEVSRGYARSIIAREVQLDRAAARVVVAADVNVQRSAILFLVARRVAGDVRVLLDWRGGLAFGAAAGLVLGLLRRGAGRKGDGGSS